MAPTLSKYVTKGNLCAAAGLSAMLWILLSRRNVNRKIHLKNDVEEIKYLIKEKEKKARPKVDKKFFFEFMKLLRIVIPGWNTREFGLVVLIAISLGSRSLCDIWLNRYIRVVEGLIVSRDITLFKQRILKYICIMPLISLVNNILKFSIGELQIHLRKNMSQHLYNHYLSKNTYYWISSLDNRINNVDQILTTDIEKFCIAVTDLYCNVAKPLLDVYVYAVALGKNLSYKTPGLLFAFVAFSGAFITEIRKPIAALTAIEQKLEGEFRFVNSRINAHSEEIAFYQGNLRERTVLFASFKKLMNHLRKFLYYQVFMGIIDDFLVKHFSFCFGFWAFSIPFFTEGHKVRSISLQERSVLYYTYGAMLVLLGQAGGRLVVAGHDLMRLAGFTQRITELERIIADLKDGKYKKTMIAGSEHLKPNSGKIIYSDNLIKFNKVPIVTPNGDILINELSLEIHSSMNVLINGPNGCGKSSLFRILGELWPLFGGEITKPPRNKLFYVPQRPYMTLGTLRDQIIYPHLKADADNCNCTDDVLKKHLERVHLEYLLHREGGFDAIADWLDVLSGGEKQRIAMARLFYHAPQFAILDECTSAVSADVEGDMYSYCREVGITLLTVSHRKSLWLYHDYVLNLDGSGSYSFNKIENHV